MFGEGNASEWLLLAIGVGVALRVTYKFGLETGREETAARFRDDPQLTLEQIQAERSAEGRFRRWARGRRG